MRSLFCSFVFFLIFIYSNEEDPRFEVLQRSSFVIVCLGADCQSLMHLRDYDLYQASFPIDWMVTRNTKDLIKLIENDFEHLVNFNHLTIRFKDGTNRLLHDDYDIELPHILDINKWGNSEFGLRPLKSSDSVNENSLEEIQAIKQKFDRRISRFHRLSQLQIPVYFFRFYVEPEDSLYEDNLKLFDVLLEKFPKLDFKLYVVNLFDAGEEQIGHERLIFDTINPIDNINIRSKKQPHKEFKAFLRRAGWIDEN